MADENNTEAQKEEPALPAAKEPLGKYTQKSWWKNFVLGVLLGFAVVVPGISGAAVAIIFRVYDKLLYAIANLFRKFKSCFLYLLPIILGLIIGFVVGFFSVRALLRYIPFALICCFAGLMAGSFPSVYSEIKGSEKNAGKIVLFILGLLIPLILGAVTVYLSKDSLSNPYIQETSSAKDYQPAIDAFGDYPWWLYLSALPIGMVIGLTQVVPGLSATAFLMMVGYYKPILDAVSLDYVKQYPQFIAFILIMAVGVILGFVFTSKLINKLFSINRDLVYHVIVGLSFGSILAIFLNPDSYAIYVAWGSGLSSGMKLDIGIAVPLAILGFLASFALVRYQAKHGKTEEKQE
jgi:putative membrane protein